MAEYPKYVEKYPIDKLSLNNWNPNEMNEEKMRQLKKSIKERKFIVPIVANPEGKIIDGEHRFIATSELIKEGLKVKTVPVILVKMTEDEMKMSTLGLNNIRGCDSPIKLAKLLQDLNQRHMLTEIAERAGYNSDTLKDRLELLKIPEALMEKLKKDAKKAEEQLPIVMHFSVTKEQEKIIAQVLEKEKGNSNGDRLYALCIKQKAK